MGEIELGAKLIGEHLSQISAQMYIVMQLLDGAHRGLTDALLRASYHQPSCDHARSACALPALSHVSRVYHPLSSRNASTARFMVRKYDWTVGPNVTRKDLQPTYRYKAGAAACVIRQDQEIIA